MRLAAAILSAVFLVACKSDDAAELARQKDVADQAQKAGNWDLAVAAYKEAASLDPSDASVRWQLGQVYLQLGAPAEADSHLRRAMELGISPSSVMPLVAKSLVQAGRYEDLIALAEPEDLSPDAHALLVAEKALAMLLSGRVKEASASIDTAVGGGANLPRVALIKARVLIAQGQQDAAVSQVRAGVVRFSQDTELWALLADLERDAGNAKLAEDAYSQAIKLSIAPVQLHVARARLRLDTGDPAGAEEDVVAVERAAPRSFPALFLRGRLALLQGQGEEAVAALQSAMVLDRFSVEALFYAGLAAQATDRASEADDLLQRAVTQAPAFLPGRHALALLRLDQGRFAEAESLIQPVVDWLPNQEATLRILAAALIAQGKYAKAVQVIEKVASAPAAEPGTVLQLGMALMASGQLSRGETVLDQLAARHPSDGGVYEFVLGYYLSTGNLAAVRRWDDRFSQAFSQSVAPLIWRARLEFAQGQAATARATLQHALDLDPQSTAARYALARFALADGQLAVVREQLQTIVAGHADHLAALLTLAALDRRAKRPADALNWLKQAVSDFPNDAEPLIALARSYIETGVPRDAIALLEGRTDERLKESPDYLRVLGEAEQRAGELRKSSLTLHELVRAAPDSASAHYAYGQSLVALDDQVGAEASLARALELDPSLQAAGVEYARVLYAQGQYDQAERALRPIRGSQAPEVLLLAGLLAEQRGALAQARTLVEEAHTVAPSARTLLILARLATSNGEPDEGIRLQVSWLQAHPEATEVRLGLAHDLAERGKRPEAIEQYLKVLERESANILALKNLAWQLRDSDPERAVDYATRAAELAPRSDVVADTLAAVLAAVGRPDDALRAIEIALVHIPESDILNLRKAKLFLSNGKETDAVKILIPLSKRMSESDEKAEATKILDDFLSSAKGAELPP